MSNEKTYYKEFQRLQKENNLTGQIHKISCYEFWEGKNSYRILQDKFYNYVKENGFEHDESNFKCKEFVENLVNIL